MTTSIASTLTLLPGQVPLAQWRAIYRGATPTLDASSAPSVQASAETVERIVAKGEPVYGINTGFGKLASVRIPAEDLETLQRNIVLSHAAGVGEATPLPIARLMMALKLASLAQGASGIRPATLALLEAMLVRGVIPVVPGQGSVGASGDLAPLSHMTEVMIGVGEAFTPIGRMPAVQALASVGLKPVVLGPKEGLALLNGTQFSTANALAGLRIALWHGSQSGKSSITRRPVSLKYSSLTCGIRPFGAPVPCGPIAVPSGWSSACVSDPHILTLRSTNHSPASL